MILLVDVVQVPAGPHSNAHPLQELPPQLPQRRSTRHMTIERHRAWKPGPTFFDLGYKSQDPSKDRRMRKSHSTFGHHLDQVTVREPAATSPTRRSTRTDLNRRVPANKLVSNTTFLGDAGQCLFR